jgi:hypothetical protein
MWMPNCVICKQAVERWLPDPGREAYSPVLRVLDVVGADADRHLCPACGCDDRERHAWLYLSRSGLLEQATGAAALHLGPEPHLRRRLAELPFQWTFPSVDAEVDDVLEGFEDGCFHLILCDRVLATVPDLRASVRALVRCLGDDGWLVTQTEYSPMLKHTLEFNVTPTEKAARLFFGGERCRRLLGSDLPAVVAGGGATGLAYAHERVLPGIDAAQWGCNPREPFFLFSRSRCPTFPS